MKAISSEHDKNEIINFQWINKFNICSALKKIKEIEGGRLLFLFDDYFMIIDIKTKKNILGIMILYFLILLN